MIIGGTSGIGLALARHYLEQGEQVAVCGRDLARMEPASPASPAGRAALREYQFDIADRAALAAALADFAGGALDMLVVTAGLYGDAPALERDPGLGLRMLRTNVGGLNHAFELASGPMVARRAGRLVALASVAGLLRDYPGASLYSANKRIVIELCNAYRKALAPFGVGVTVIVPGYVDTAALRALNQGDASHKPFLQTEAQAVARIAQAIAQGRARCVFPWQMQAMVAIFNRLPLWLKQIRKK